MLVFYKMSRDMSCSAPSIYQMFILLTEKTFWSTVCFMFYFCKNVLLNDLLGNCTVITFWKLELQSETCKQVALKENKIKLDMQYVNISDLFGCFLQNDFMVMNLLCPYMFSVHVWSASCMVYYRTSHHALYATPAAIHRYKKWNTENNRSHHCTAFEGSVWGVFSALCDTHSNSR